MNRPIGFFDSGVGGLSVLREIVSLLPHESYCYIADSAHVPYGNKSAEWIRDRSLELSDFLIRHGAKAIVIACNTATAAAAANLRARWPEVPIIGMEPAIKPAVAATRKGVVGVLATVGTVQSARFAALLGQFASDVRVVTQPAPGLPECVERGESDGPAVEALVASYIQPLREAGVDVIVLGCTHYPFLRRVIERLAGPDVAVIDTGAAVARQVRRRLEEKGLLAPTPASTSKIQFWTSGSPPALQPVISRLWGDEVDVCGLG